MSSVVNGVRLVIKAHERRSSALGYTRHLLLAILIGLISGLSSEAFTGRKWRPRDTWYWLKPWLARIIIHTFTGC